MARTARLPKKVRDAEKRAAALMKERTENQAAPTVAIVPDPVEEEEIPAEEILESPAETFAEASAEEVLPPLDSEVEDPVWEQRYNALKGKYDSEIPRMRGTIDGLQQRLSELEKAPAAPAAPAAVEVISSQEDADDRENYGDDFVNLVERRAKQIVEVEIAKLTPQLQKMSGEVAETRRMTVQERMHVQLDSQVKDWRDINTSSEFLAWLETSDSFTGVPRSTLLRGAYDSGHSDRVIAIFNGYISDTAPATPVPALQTRKSDRANLADLAAPGSTRTAGRGPTEALPPAPVTRQDIQAFYSNVAKGVYKNRQEDQVKMEAKINAAVAHGLVT